MDVFLTLCLCVCGAVPTSVDIAAPLSAVQQLTMRGD
jgi:hypothetical protein